MGNMEQDPNAPAKPIVDPAAGEIKLPAPPAHVPPDPHANLKQLRSHLADMPIFKLDYGLALAFASIGAPDYIKTVKEGDYLTQIDDLLNVYTVWKLAQDDEFWSQLDSQLGA